MQLQLRKFALLALAGLMVLGASVAAHAGIINVQATDQELTYLGMHEGGQVFDSPDADGGNLDPTEADLLNALQFNLNGNAPPASGGNNVFVSNMATGYYGDFLVNDVGATVPVSNIMLSTIGGGGYEFGFDLFSSSGGGSAPILRLAFDTVDLLVNSGVVLISAKANIVSQDLPFGLLFDATKQLDFAYTATMPGVPPGANIGMFVAGGTINISGADLIPEPASLTMLLASMLGLCLAGTRRRS
jgi:hypothetical protein